MRVDERIAQRSSGARPRESNPQAIERTRSCVCRHVSSFQPLPSGERNATLSGVASTRRRNMSGTDLKSVISPPASLHYSRRGGGRLAHFDAVPAGALGAVEEGVDAPEEVLAGFAGREGAYAETDRRRNGLSVVDERLGLDGFPHAIAELRGAFDRRLGQHDGELLAAVPSQELVAPHTAAHDVRDAPQDPVSREMVEAVVHG